MSCTYSRERPPSSGKICHHSTFIAHFKIQYKWTTFRICFIFTTNHQCYSATSSPQRETTSPTSASHRLDDAPHFPAVCSLWGQNQASAGSSLFLSHVAVIKISSIANCLCRRIAAFASLIGNTQSSCEHHLVMTSSASRRACPHVCVLALQRCCNQFCAR